jgi:hypothetical protein
MSLQHHLQDSNRGWPVRDRVLNQRVVYPHLAADYDELPADLRARISREQADEHGESIMSAQHVIEQVSQGDATLRAALIGTAAGVVLRAHWPQLALSVALDTAENIAATPDFYWHLGVLLIAGNESFDRLFPGDFTRWTFTRMGQYHRPATRLYLSSSVLALLSCSAAALAVAWAHRRERAAWLDWLPVGAFVVLNALAFACAADVTTIRYTLVAHAVLLLLVFGGGLRWVDSKLGAP